MVLKSISTAPPPVAGDYNRDGTVDATDYGAWRQFVGISTRNGLAWAIASADGNGNGRVDAADYVVWRKNLGASAAAAMAAGPPLPEPSALYLLLYGATLAVGYRNPRGK
jgi:hypothetical protein